MRRDVYVELSRLLSLPVGSCPNTPQLLARYGGEGLTVDTLVSLLAQEVQQKVMRSNHTVKQRIHSYTDRYLKGADILELSTEADFPPCMLMRRMLEDLLPPGSKQAVGDLLKQPSRLTALLGSPQQQQQQQQQPGAVSPPSSQHHRPGQATAAGGGGGGRARLRGDQLIRLQADVSRCTLADMMNSPWADAARQAAGQEYELLLAWQLRQAGVSWFWTEAELRSQGHFKTPDIRLQVPIAVCSTKKGCGAGGGGDGSPPQAPVWRVVTWIDSKATFGDDRIHRKQMEEQYSTYVNRFGPGLVIYWFGFIDDLDSDADVLLMDHFPEAHELCVLDQAPVTLPAEVP